MGLHKQPQNFIQAEHCHVADNFNPRNLAADDSHADDHAGTGQGGLWPRRVNTPAGSFSCWQTKVLPSGRECRQQACEQSDIFYSEGFAGVKLERVKGIEPSLSAWEAGVMPLYDTRKGRLFTRS